MFTVVETEEFLAWLEGLKDRETRIRLSRRIDKARRGLLGDVKPVGDGVHEMREFFGPGWRMYYVLREGIVILMLGGGDKDTQDADIERAKQLAQELKDDQDQDPAV
jgi:putative addiction module killer protein